ncbi:MULTISPECIES: hypothetical protein [unclassified Variovorax]|uniref:hypothetical protein n=1 Tax=unclassified Variovorax TaxID=663243 RepID=UPI002578017C|nr:MULTISPECIES: hypothetical protein [unclassified Variovorax]MDM0047790.1 hypothetical protein [Variovorax sp. J22R115]
MNRRTNSRMDARSFEASGRRRTLIAACLLVCVPAALAIGIGWSVSDIELRKTLYAAAITLVFAGLFGGLLKVQLDEVAAFKRKREDAASFVTNVLADLKGVFDQVARARILIPAHQSVATYGDEMRALITARVQLRNVVRALERRADGVDEETRSEVTRLVRRMDDFLEGLTCEFRDNYKRLSDQQRGYEKRAEALLKQFAEDPSRQTPPELPVFVWNSLSELPRLADFIGPANDYRIQFEAPLDDASAWLRNELARILGSTPLGSLRGQRHTQTPTEASRA